MGETLQLPGNGLMRRFSLAQLSAEFDASADATWLVDPESFTILWANPVALALWRAADVDELRARDYQSDMSTAAKDRVRSYRQAVEQRGRIVERWTFYPDGQPVTLACTISPLVTEAQTFCLLAQAFSRGTLDRIGLREEETLRHSGVLISAYDESGNLLLRNPAAAAEFIVSDRSISSHFAVPEEGAELFRQALGDGQSWRDLRVIGLRGQRWHRMTARRGVDPETGLPMVVLTEIEVEDITASHSRLQESQRLYRQLNEIVLDLNHQPAFRQGELDQVARLLEERITASMIATALFVALPEAQDTESLAETGSSVFPAPFSTTMRDVLSAQRALLVESDASTVWPRAVVERARTGPLLASGIWNGHLLTGVLLLRLGADPGDGLEGLIDFIAGIADQLSTLFVSRHRQQTQRALQASRAGGSSRHEARELSCLRIDEQLNIIQADEALAATLGLSRAQLESLSLSDILAEADRALMLGHLSRVRMDPRHSHNWRSCLRDIAGRPRWFELTARRGVDTGNEPISLLLASETEPQQSDIESHYEAIYDTLTGTLNRREIEGRIGALSANQHHYALAYFNIDDFRILNTLGGIALGDRVLTEFGKILRANCRPQDFVGRMGADEFLLVMPGMTLEQAGSVAATVQKNLLNIGVGLLAWFPEIADTRQVKACAGITLISDPESSELAAIGAAFGACLDAKATGAGSLGVHDAGQAAGASAYGGSQILPRVIEAIKGSGFELYVEPIVAVLDGGRGATPRQEILIRMRGSDGTLIQPGGFIPAAERHGLMPEIDRWVLTELSRLLCLHPELESRAERWHVNVSATTISDPRFADYASEHFKPPSGAGLHRICFEITETAAAESLAQISQVIRDLRQRGAEVAIDDFGVGQATYDYLRRLGVDILKIDGSFVRRLAHSQIDCAIVKSIVDVSAAFGIMTIAEFIENPEIESVAIGLGVQFLQGYGLARPRPLLSMLQDKLEPVIAAEPCEEMTAIVTSVAEPSAWLTQVLATGRNAFQ